MLLLDQLAEARIREAAARGELSNLPGEGKPLDLNEEPLLDPSLAAINRVLKNAGFLPPAIQQLADLEEAVQRAESTACPASRRRQLLLLRSQISRLNDQPAFAPGLRVNWLLIWARRLHQLEG